MGCGSHSKPVQEPGASAAVLTPRQGSEIEPTPRRSPEGKPVTGGESAMPDPRGAAAAPRDKADAPSETPTEAPLDETPAASNASTESASKGVSEGATAVEQEGARVRVEGEQRSSCLPGACQWFVLMLTGSA